MHSVMQRKPMESTVEKISIVLVSSDGEKFNVKKRAVSRSRTIMKGLRFRPKSDHNSPVVLDKIDGKTLEKVIEYCNYHYVPYNRLGHEDVVSRLHDFDAKFVNVDQTTFFALHGAAKYLKINSLIDLICEALLKKFERTDYREFEEVIENWKQNAD